MIHPAFMTRWVTTKHEFPARHSGRFLAGIQFFELLDPGQSLSPQALSGEHAGMMTFYECVCY
jgi:hypothetical protein